MPIEIEKIIQYQPGYQSPDHEIEDVPRPVPNVPRPNVPILNVPKPIVPSPNVQTLNVPRPNVPIPGQSGHRPKVPVPNQYYVPVMYAPRPTLNQSQPRMNSYVPRRGAPVRKRTIENVPSPPDSSLIPSRKNSRAYKGSSKCSQVLFSFDHLKSHSRKIKSRVKL